jgi:hypothetical protein
MVVSIVAPDTAVLQYDFMVKCPVVGQFADARVAHVNLTNAEIEDSIT